MADIPNVRQEIRDAAKALTLTSFCEPTNNEEDKSLNHIWLAAFNEALNYLVKTGLTKTLSFVDDELTYAREDCLAFAQIMRFFSDNPGAQVAMPLNFSEGSLAREVLDAFVRETAFDKDPPKGLAIDVAAAELTSCRRNLERLLLAREAIQRAIASEHR
jgi:hypothetical protein